MSETGGLAAARFKTAATVSSASRTTAVGYAALRSAGCSVLSRVRLGVEVGTHREKGEERTLTLSVLQSLFGDKLVNLQVFFPQNGTAALKGLTEVAYTR